MNPLITNPTLVAIHQYLYLLGMIAALVAPLAKGVPALYAFLQRLAGAGGDVGKVFGARRVPTENGPAPVKTSTPGPTITSALMTVCISALAGCLFVGMLGVTLACSMAKTIVHDATGAVCEIVLQDVVHVDNPQICTTALEVESVIADWVATHVAAKPGEPAPKPSSRDVYLAVAAKHGVTVK